MFFSHADVFTFLHRLAAIMGATFLPVLPQILDVIASSPSDQVQFVCVQMREEMEFYLSFWEERSAKANLV